MKYCVPPSTMAKSSMDNGIYYKWNLSTMILEKRSYHSAVAFRENIYVLGGLNQEVGRLRSYRRGTWH